VSYAQYLVFDPERSHSRFLSLDGPAASPKWGAIENATPMTFARAHSFANAYGSKQAIVVNVERARELAAKAEEAPSTLTSFGGWFGYGATD